MDAMETGRRVRAARAYAGFSQATLARRVGMGRGTLWKIECGEREAKRGELWQISEACQIPMWILENPWHEYPTRRKGDDMDPRTPERPKRPRSTGRE